MIDDLACSIYSAFYYHFYQLGASLCKRGPQTPRKHQGERVSTLSPPEPPLSTTKEGGLRSPLFGNTP